MFQFGFCFIQFIYENSKQHMDRSEINFSEQFSQAKQVQMKWNENTQNYDWLLVFGSECKFLETGTFMNCFESWNTMSSNIDNFEKCCEFQIVSKYLRKTEKNG